MSVRAYVDENKTWVISFGACVVATWLLWHAKISDVVWWGAIGTFLVPLVAKEGAVQIKNIGAGNTP